MLGRLYNPGKRILVLVAQWFHQLREISAQKIPRTMQKILSHGFLLLTNRQGVILQPSTMTR
uniref:Uncharacterized protein n=1 Tax=Arundo donax TaxID=35708 RepID=A0A0A9CH26_ARUDO